MTRDFTEAAKQKLISQIEEVTETSWWGKVGDFFGDRWLDIQSWTGRLSIQNYLDDVDAYHKKILDQRNTKIQEIETIFARVRNLDYSSGKSFKNTVDDMQQKIAAIRKVSDVISIPASSFTAVAIQDYFEGKVTLSEVKQGGRDKFYEELVIEQGSEVERGKIRYYKQKPGLCNRACETMAFSYLGIDVNARREEQL